MTHKLKFLLLMCTMTVVLLAPGAAQARGRTAIFVGPRFGWGLYDPFWAPYRYGFYGGYYYAPATGAVKFDTEVKDAGVFIDGAYAGTVGKLKTLHLRPGSYNIELRAAGHSEFTEKIYVVAGKTLHLNPDLRVQAQP